MSGTVEGFFTIDLDTAATANGNPIDLRGIAGFSVHVQHGAITGTLVLQERNHTRLNWVAVGDVSLTAPAGSAASQIVNVGNARSRYYRVVYTHSSGTGELRVCLHAKGD
jgi:hypothetical protein